MSSWFPGACYNKLPPMCGLKQQTFITLKFWRQGTPNQGVVSLRGRMGSMLAGIWWPPAAILASDVSLNLCLRLLPGCLLSVSVCLNPPFLSLLKTLVIRFRAHPKSRMISPLLNLIASCKDPISKEVSFAGTGGENLEVSFWETIIQPKTDVILQTLGLRRS